MRAPVACCVAAFLLHAAVATPAGTPKRAAVGAMEQLADRKLVGRDDPFELLGNTRGAYLDGYGAVFTTEVSLAFTQGPNPFRGPLTKQEIAGVHERKKQRLPVLRQAMQDFLIAAGASLDNVDAKEKVAYFVNLYYHNWEDTTGLPQQIVMESEKQKLLDVQSGRLSRANLDRWVKVREL